VIQALDHVVVAVRDLDSAIATYQTLLGRAPSWRAGAHEGGAEIAVFGLGNMAVELMAPSGDGGMAPRLSALLDAQGEGLASLAFAVDGVEHAHRRLARLGLDPEAIVHTVTVDRASGTRRQWWRTRASTRATSGVRVFLLEPSAPPPSPALVDEAAAVAGLDHVVIRTPNPDRAAALYGARLGLDMRLDRTNAAWGARLMFFRCGDLVVEIAHDLAGAVSSGEDRLWGLSWRVPDAASAWTRLRGAGVDVTELRAGRKPGTRVFTVRDQTCGVPTLMLEPPARANETDGT
jgi:catechol 2,3-dioxygenase-like lactoylglutathione lyase family enzyme